MKVELENVTVSFKQKKNVILEDITFTIQPGEVVAMLGFSGAGKSTLVKLISSFIKPQSGTAKINGNNIILGRPYTNLGYLSQASDKMLFPWLTVEKNIYYALKSRKKLTKENRQFCESIIEVLNLSHRRKAYPFTLSGGEQKRLSLGMVLSYRPDLILLDEPFAGLDLELTKNLWDVLYLQFRNYKPTVLFITHSLDEAALLADRTMFITKTRRLLVDNKCSNDFAIPQSIPRYELMNNLSTTAYKEHLLSLFNQSLRE